MQSSTHEAVCGSSGFSNVFIYGSSLNFLDDSGLGGKIGNINVCAPTCTDDVALIAYNPLDIQTMEAVCGSSGFSNVFIYGSSC
jgi:hypothetical protein